MDFPNNRLVIEALLTLTKPLKRVSRELTTYNLFDEEEEAAVVTNSEGNFTSPLSRTSKGAGDIDMKEENSKIVVKSGDYVSCN